MRKWTTRRYLLWVIAVVAVTATAYWLYANFNLIGPSEFTLATGREGGAYYGYAADYAALLVDDGVTLKIQPTAGSVQTLQQLIAREIPVGFVQSGTAQEMDDTDLTGLFSLGSLFYEPLFVFYRQDAFSQPLEYLLDLRGRTIAIGEVGSGTNKLARLLLAENDITEENTTFVEVAVSEAHQLLRDGTVDAGFFVLAPKASVLFDLLLDPDLEMMSFRRAPAYEARFPYLTEFVVTEGTVDLVRNIPSESKTILATTATLVGNELLHPDSARQLLTAAITVHQAGGYFEQEGEFPSATNTELTVPPQVADFLERGPTDLEKYLPLSLASALERFIFVVVPVIIILYPLLRGAGPAFNWVFRYQIYRWYQRLRAVENQLYEYSPEELDEAIRQMEELQQYLTRRIRVPLFYQQDFYNLRLHLQLVINRLKQRQEQLANQARPDGDGVESEQVEPPQTI
ncbi:MAG: ABC transporter substrate-binding protein [Caldilineaceae bacterium]|nr:ABC transporter substrate-binding protein [Caldilineaceae bacterium]